MMTVMFLKVPLGSASGGACALKMSVTVKRLTPAP